MEGVRSNRPVVEEGLRAEADSSWGSELHRAGPEDVGERSVVRRRVGRQSVHLQLAQIKG